MTDRSGQETDQELPELTDDSLVYRVILRRASLDADTGTPLPDLFLRRPRNHDGLSVHIADRCSPEECTASFDKTYGVAVVRVGDIRDLGLDVQPDAAAHANIIGLPLGEDNRKEAERLAGLLARKAKIL